MKAFDVQLTDEQKSEVKEVYRRYYRGKWYQSDTQQAGYEKYYYATKVRIRLYYKEKEKAQLEADKYNKRLKSYKKGRAGKAFPDVINWDMLEGTEVHDKYKWERDNGSWLYEHHWLEDVKTEELLKDDMDYETYDHHTTKEFFGILIMKKYHNYELYENENEEWSIVYK